MAITQNLVALSIVDTLKIVGAGDKKLWQYCFNVYAQYIGKHFTNSEKHVAHSLTFVLWYTPQKWRCGTNES